MEFRVLGSLEVIDGDRRIDITAPKQRALLAVLLLSANRVVSADRLLDELWGETPPAGGLNTLHFHISKLRAALQPGRKPGDEGMIETRASGYVLVVDPDLVDAFRFERLVGEARTLLIADPAAASACLEEALGLWRGPALADFTYEPFSQTEIRRLEELRLSAVEDRIDADLALGRHQGVIVELEKLVAEYPLRERPWGQLMVALYRSGRQADALRAYQDLRTRLGEELGIDPSLDIQSLEDRILLQDPGLAAPGPA